MSVASHSALTLQHRFASDLAALAVPWQAAAAPEPRLLVLNETLATQLGLDPVWLRSEEGVRLLVGAHVPEGALPVAQAYAGHQFGGWSPRLGDGRALLLGELPDTEGKLFDLHLKGSGRTPFSRGGDGLAAVGPMLREHLVSESMHALDIPTTRSLAVTATGRPVQRETVQRGAVLARVASSHLRVGTFEYTATAGDLDLLRRLADHAIARHHPGAAERPDRYRGLFEAVIQAQASLVARWMLVGFVHGVMNTDNMTISGETIDYGPCAFLDAHDPATVFSSIDERGRYAYGNQPAVAEWNLARLAEALLPLLHEDQGQAVALAVESLGRFQPLYAQAWATGLHAKLGLSGGHEAETAVAEDLLPLLVAARADHTGFFRRLSAAARGDAGPVLDLVANRVGLQAWLDRWRVLEPDPVAMDRVNPCYVPRNHLVEEALTAATLGDLEPFRRLLEVLGDPFTERPGLERFAEPAPEDFGSYRTFCGT